ncbi:MAG: SAM-dependent methyltransferase [Planctomycetaceae bacterium]|nr:SAM-dependent methyltransferase [Planctomycetaceae bacterium]
MLCDQRIRQTVPLAAEHRLQATLDFVEHTRSQPIALFTQEANDQHYELPPEFFTKCLGHRLKYSCCYWPVGVETLDDAEDAALKQTCKRARLEDGQDILELGCGWGSLSLWMAEHYPKSQITAVSNSSSQKEFIDGRAKDRGLENLTIVTSDMNDFSTEATFDRVVSVEMFEHLRNYGSLLERISSWLNPEGLLFVHIFCHQHVPYVFETEGAGNWMGRYFFSGGTMPSDDLLLHYGQHMSILDRWRWNGRHYERTSNAWLEKMDEQRDSIMPAFEQTYGADAAKMWFIRWRLFYLAVAELFGYQNGEEWWVSHYLFQRNAK